jgi:hypothetical protein
MSNLFPFAGFHKRGFATLAHGITIHDNAGTSRSAARYREERKE